MLQANELLYGILKTLGKIEANTRGKGSPGPAAGGVGGEVKDKIGALSNLGPALLSFGKVKPKSIKAFFRFMEQFVAIGNKTKNSGKGLKNVADSLSILGRSLPELAEGMDSLGKIKQRQVSMALGTLQSLYEFMEEKGETRSTRKVDRAVKTFEKIAKTLKDIAKPIKDISLSFAYLGLGILAFAGSLLLTSMILRLSKPTDVLMFLGVTVLGLLVMFGMLALANRFVKTGTKTIAEMGLGMVALSLGIISFALTLHFLPKILGSESGGSIVKSLLIMVGIVAAMALMFTILSFMEPVTKKGFISILWMTAGLAVLSLAILGMAEVAKLLSQGGLSAVGKSKEEKDEGKRAIIGGLGMMGIIILSAIALFRILGIPGFSTIIKSGAITMMLMGGALIVMALSLKELVGVGKELAGDDIGTILTHLIGGTIDGFIGGLASLSEGKTGVQGVAAFIKNSAKIFAGVGVLMSMSLALSMFAKAVSAFAELENMRIIEGYDKDGKPIFGEKVNLTKVADNIAYSISTFLTALIESTEGLTKEKAAAIRKMGRALTGKRGILSAVIQFADAMKLYAEFGEANEIGYVDFDDKGNEIKKKVKATVVVDNMIGSFLYFTEKLFGKSESEFGDGEPEGKGISGKQKRRMQKMSKALIGRHGILSAVIQFADAMKVYAEFGENNEIGYVEYDDKGNEIRKKVKATTVVDNIIRTFLYFSEQLFSKSESEFGDGEEAGISGRPQGNGYKRMQKMSKALIGRHGILGAVVQFSEVVRLFSEFGEKNELPVLDKDGKPTGETISMATISNNIVKALTTFSDTLADKLPSNVDTAAIQKYSGIIEELSKFSESLDSLQKANETIADLAKSINDLSVSLDNFDQAKLSKLSAISISAGGSGATGAAAGATTAEKIEAKTKTVKESTTPATNWDLISAQIGTAVGAQLIDAMKKGQVKFEFSPSSPGKGVLTFD